MTGEQPQDRYSQLQELFRHNGLRSITLGLIGSGAVYLGYNSDFRPLTAAGIFTLVGSFAYLDAADRALSQQEHDIDDAIDQMATYNEEADSVLHLQV